MRHLKASGKAIEIPVIPFRPTMNMDDYKAIKAAANASVTTDRQDEMPASRTLAPPSYIGPDIEGVNKTEAGGWRPPDTHGAVGPEPILLR